MFTANALTFLNDLSRNNTRDWFADNKATYDAEIKQPAKAFGAVIAAGLEQQTGERFTAKLFRINRDLRFSKDKTPYNTHLHMSFLPQASKSAPAFMFGLSPEYFTLGCGCFAFDKSALTAFRTLVDGASGAEFVALLDGLTGQGLRLSKPELKRVPAPYDQDHPRGTYLRHKGLAAWIDAAPEQGTGPDLPTRCLEGFAKLGPLYTELRQL